MNDLFVWLKTISFNVIYLIIIITYKFLCIIDFNFNKYNRYCEFYKCYNNDSCF